MPNRCAMCKKEEEKVEHLLVQCEFASELWDQMVKQLQLQWAKPCSTTKIIVLWWLPWSQDKTRRVWAMIALHVLWAIWKERNARIFKEHSRMVEETLQTCLKLTVVENVEVCVKVDHDKDVELAGFISLLRLESHPNTTSDEIRRTTMNR